MPPPPPATQSFTYTTLPPPPHPTAPFITAPAETWPRIVIEREALVDGTAPPGELAFAVEHKGELAAIALDGGASPRAAVFPMRKGKAPTVPLQILAPEATPKFGRVHVLACKQSGDRCVQTVFSGSWNSTEGTGRQNLHIILDAVPDDTMIVRGAPVIDQYGYVLAAATGPGRAVTSTRYVLEASDVRGALPP
jgi:hypothetical protein